MSNDLKKDIINFFYIVRDMPYYINVAPMDYHKYVAYCRDQRTGSCTPKHLYLAKILEFYKSDDLIIKYNASLFNWADLSLDYPSNIKNVVKELSPTVHLSLIVSSKEYFINDVLLDASWDCALKGIGLTINDLNFSDSGELQSTTNAVIPMVEKVFDTPYDYLNYVNILRVKDEKKKHFYYELNKWFSEVRRNNGKTMG
ncbi:MAG: hypothetical protein ACP5N1_04855 [Candidatus Woesearchaeota archaeon]